MTEAGPSTSSAQADESNGGSSPSADQSVWQSNLQRIQQRKQQVYNWPHSKKLLKLAIYSACQIEDCKCGGWKAPAPPPKNSKVDVAQPLANFTDPCHNCTHVLGMPKLVDTCNIVNQLLNRLNCRPTLVSFSL